MKLVVKLLSPDAIPSLASTCWVTRLEHKVFDVSATEMRVVEGRATQHERTSFRAAQSNLVVL